MPAESQIRKASPEDAQTIAEFQVAMAWESEKLRLDPRVCGRGVAAVFEDPSRGGYWICERGGKAVGCLLVTLEWSDWRNGAIWWIHSVYVVPEARRTGVFRAMYDAIRERVEADPAVQGLRLYVEKSNTRAQAVYRKLGMTDEHYHLYEWLKA